MGNLLPGRILNVTAGGIVAPSPVNLGSSAINLAVVSSIRPNRSQRI